MSEKLQGLIGNIYEILREGGIFEDLNSNPLKMADIIKEGVALSHPDTALVFLESSTNIRMDIPLSSIKKDQDGKPEISFTPRRENAEIRDANYEYEYITMSFSTKKGNIFEADIPNIAFYPPTDE